MFLTRKSTEISGVLFVGVAVAGTTDVAQIKSFSTSITPVPDSAWEDLEALFGAWSNLPENKIETWFEELRDSDRLSEIYGDEWD